MKQRAENKSNAVVAIGERVDHDQDKAERKKRELAAAFNRMGSDSDGEAHTAFDRARQLTEDLSLSFDAIYRAFYETIELREANAKLGRQLRQVLQENAKYRSINIWYKVKLRLGELLRASYYALCYAAPLFLIFFLYREGYVRAMGAMLLAAPVGIYNISKGLVKRSFARLAFGSGLLLASLVGFMATADQDSPFVHRRVTQLIENMNRDQEFGPKTFYIEYPLSNATLAMTVVGFKNTAKITVEGKDAPLEVSCAKYYENSIIVPNSRLAEMPPPETPDIYHRVEAASFGPCELYAQVEKLHEKAP